jgi:hypothetical protein
VTPYQARVEAQRVLAERAAGRDPQAEKRDSKRRLQSDQVANLIAEFISRHVAQNRTARETTRILHREVVPNWGTWAIHEVRKRDVIALLDKMRERGAPVMANRVLAALRKFFAGASLAGFLSNRLAQVSGYRTASSHGIGYWSMKNSGPSLSVVEQ